MMKIVTALTSITGQGYEIGLDLKMPYLNAKLEYVVRKSRS
jgi:hypothetical protein